MNQSCYLDRFLPKTITDAEGNTTGFVYENGKPKTVTNALNQVTVFDYNPDGTTKSVINPRGQMTRFEYHYDGTGGGIVASTDPSGRVTYANFDALGRLQSARSASGDVTQCTYDELGRLFDIYQAKSGSRLTSVYDPSGNVVRLTAKEPGKTDRDTIFIYDSRNRVISKRMPDAQNSLATFEYDGVGNLTSKTLTSWPAPANTVKYHYDAVNRLDQLTEPDGKVVTYEDYDANDRPKTITYKDGDMTIHRQWDGAGRLREIQAVSTNSSYPLVDLNYGYAFTPAGKSDPIDSPRVHSMKDITAGDSSEYYYDPIGQLLLAATRKLGAWSWAYDPNGNRSTQNFVTGGRSTVTNYSYDDADQLSSTSTNGGSVSYQYDDNGNLVSRSDGLKLTYDSAQNTVAATPPGGSGPVIKMTYDNFDQMQRTSVQPAGQPVSTFTYDGASMGPSSSQTGASQTYFVRTPGGSLVSMKRGGNTFYYITDGLGSVVALTSNASGQAAIVNQYQYSPWGEIVSQNESPDVQQPFRFAGTEYDASLRLYKMGARHYNPAEGRFAQLDPLGGGYTYSSNDPVNFADPSGYEEEPW